MKKALICALICTLIFATLLTGCSKNGIKDISEEDVPSRFVCVESNSLYEFIVVYDQYTKVMYAVSTGMCNEGDFSVLVDEDGKPLLWKGK